MIPPPDPGRPLDPSEARQFELIVQSLPELALDAVVPDTTGDPRGEVPVDDADPPHPAPTAARTPEPPAPPRVEPLTAAHATTANPLPWRHVAAVLLVAAVFALLVAALPNPLNLWTPVALFSTTAVLSVIWGWRRSRRRGS